MHWPTIFQLSLLVAFANTQPQSYCDYLRAQGIVVDGCSSWAAQCTHGEICLNGQVCIDGLCSPQSSFGNNYYYTSNVGGYCGGITFIGDIEQYPCPSGFACVKGQCQATY